MGPLVPSRCQAYLTGVGIRSGVVPHQRSHTSSETRVCVSETEVEGEPGVVCDVEDDFLSLGAQVKAILEGGDPDFVSRPVAYLGIACSDDEAIVAQVDLDAERWLIVATDPEQGFISRHRASVPIPRLASGYPRIRRTEGGIRAFDP